MIDAFGACQIDVPLIDARAFHDRRKLLQGLANFAALLPALLEWHGHAERVRAEAKRARDRHRRAHAELTSFVGRGADDAAALARAADDEQRRLAGAVRIDGARDRDIECVSICQEYPTHSRRYAEESGYVQTDAFLAQLVSWYRSVNALPVSFSAALSWVFLYEATPAQYSASGAASAFGNLSTISRNR